MAQNRFLQWMVFDWPVKVLAFAAAVLLFFFVQFMEVEERKITVRPEVESSTLFEADMQYITDVDITLRGRERDIYYIKPEDLHVHLDLSDLDRSGLHRVDVEIEKSPIFNRLGEVEIIPRPSYLSIYVQERQQQE